MREAPELSPGYSKDGCNVGGWWVVGDVLSMFGPLSVSCNEKYLAV